MSRRVELVCDGCDRRVPRGNRDDSLPEDWRRIHVRHGNRNWTLDVCSAYCASKAVDTTYEHQDRLDAIRMGLRLVDSGQ